MRAGVYHANSFYRSGRHSFGGTQRVEGGCIILAGELVLLGQRGHVDHEPIPYIALQRPLVGFIDVRDVDQLHRCDEVAYEKCPSAGTFVSPRPEGHFRGSGCETIVKVLRRFRRLFPYWSAGERETLATQETPLRGPRHGERGSR